MRVDTIKNDMATHICRKCGYTVTEPIPQPAKKSDKNNKDQTKKSIFYLTLDKSSSYTGGYLYGPNHVQDLKLLSSGN